ncbi:maltose ABC transporter permease MalF [Sesbania bispinosa]|nr:maltose ABC transporter permease MalF [Sesbania bispinosa]
MKKEQSMKTTHRRSRNQIMRKTLRRGNQIMRKTLRRGNELKVRNTWNCKSQRKC